MPERVTSPEISLPLFFVLNPFGTPKVTVKTAINIYRQISKRVTKMLYKCLKRISHDRKFNVSRKITTENFIAVSPYLFRADG